MKQQAQFKLTGIAGIAGKHLEVQKNRRRLLRGMGVNLAATPTPEQPSSSPVPHGVLYQDMGKLEKLFAYGAGIPRIAEGGIKAGRRLFIGDRALRFPTMHPEKKGPQEFRVDGRLYIDGVRWPKFPGDDVPGRLVRGPHAGEYRERPVGVPQEATFNAAHYRWELIEDVRIDRKKKIVGAWAANGDELYPHDDYSWKSVARFSEWVPPCRKARELHYNRMAGDARGARNAVDRTQATRIAENFARVISQFGYARAELYNSDKDFREHYGESAPHRRAYENWRSTTPSKGTDPMFLTAQDACDRELAQHPYYLGHAFTEATGWYLIGSGAYSYAFANDMYPDIVVKLGKNRDDACFSYLNWASRNQHLHGVPSVYFLRDYQMDYKGGGFYVAVMDKLVHDGYKASDLAMPTYSDPRKWEQKIPASASSSLKAVYETLQLIWETCEGSPDLHSGNILFTKDGHPVITDPYC
jgi:hypothetical protein